MSAVEHVPLCSTCPLRGTELTDEEGITIRQQAANYQYSDEYYDLDPSDILEKLSQEIRDDKVAIAAVECIGKIMRNNCATVERPFTSESKVRLVARKKLY